MSVHQKPRDKAWYASYRDASGRQRTRVFGKGPEAKKSAQAFDLRLKADRKEGVRPQIRSRVYMDTLCQTYLDERRAMGNVSQHYIYEIKLLLNNHILPLLSDKPVDELTYADLLKVADRYKDRSPSTRNRYFGYLRAIFRFGIRHGITKNNPLKEWRKTKEEARRSAITADDVRRIIAFAPEHLKWAMEVQWNLGTRPGPSELLSIRWNDVDFDKNRVNVYASKTKKWREIPISAEFKERLLAKQKDSQSGFVIEYKGHPIKRFRRSFQTACRQATINCPARMYDLRHLFASLMLRGGADLAAVSKLLGHSTTHMTANVYYDLLQGEKERAIKLLPSLTPADDMGKDSAKVIPIRMLR